MMPKQEDTCSLCSRLFYHDDEDLRFYEKISPTFDGKRFQVPAPTLCRFCRERQRLAFRNERSLYRRRCDATGKEVVSIYSPRSPFIVYEQESWWSDRYDPLAYAREVDFSKPFFAQFNELFHAVPKVSIQNSKSINSAYTNYSNENKNCYLMVGTLQCEDCYYGYRVFHSKNVVDCYDLIRCELCYECLESVDLYNCSYCRGCQNSNDLRYCEDCIGCHDCFGSINLRNKKFFVLNEQLSEAAYRDAVGSWMLNRGEFERRYQALRSIAPVRAIVVRNCESSYGDQLINCQSCFEAYSFRESRDCRYVGNGEKGTDCQDCNFFDGCELQYFTTNAGPNVNVLFSYLVWYGHDIIYSGNCLNSDHLFGCTGMKKQSYCILNKQYSKDDYDHMVARILTHMQQTGEWGRFFPIELSAFAYNETVAHDLYPLSKDEVMSQGWRWIDRDAQDYKKASYTLPSTIGAVPDSIVNEILSCDDCSKNYRVTAQELVFYRKQELSPPQQCPDCRHRKRMAKRNLRDLTVLSCAHCKDKIPSAVRNPEAKVVVCERCYDGALI